MSLENRNPSRRVGALAVLVVILMLLAAGSSPVVADGSGIEPPNKVADTLEGDSLMGCSPAEDPYDPSLDVITTVLETLLLIP